MILSFDISSIKFYKTKTENKIMSRYILFVVWIRQILVMIPTLMIMEFQDFGARQNLIQYVLLWFEYMDLHDLVFSGASQSAGLSMAVSFLALFVIAGSLLLLV
mmetsp:Transcript_10348/g.12923  ORF Transcript_10348/g.12923 Transcript_10348/m.12923 type:complete len:104 (-) Transcript_10348:1104-1415(-)